MRVFIVGLNGQGNLGDDLISNLLVNEHVLGRWPDAEIGVLCGDQGNPFNYKDPKRVILFPPPRLSKPRSYLNRSRRIGQFLRGSDVVLIGGGGLFQDSHSPFTIHGWLKYVLRNSGKKPLVLVIGAGFGPVSIAFNNCYIKWILPILSAVQVRDLHSQRYTERLGIKASLSTDIVAGSSLRLTPFGSAMDEKNCLVLGCSLRPWPTIGPEEITSLLVRACKELRVQEIRLFVFEHTSEGNNGERLFNEAVAARLRARGLATSLYCYNDCCLTEFAEAFREPTYAIAMRFHANILWQRLGVRVLPLSYAPKVSSLYEENGRRVLTLSQLLLERQLRPQFYKLPMNDSYRLPEISLHSARKHVPWMLVLLGNAIGMASFGWQVGLKLITAGR